MNDYLALGHMEVAAKPSKYFIPYHPVVKRDTTGIKIRVVFEASASASTGSSLNECLVTGPKLQTEISDVLLRNRLRKFVFTADITKMYRQIRIHERDRVYQHIFWRSSHVHLCIYLFIYHFCVSCLLPTEAYQPQTGPKPDRGVYRR